METLHSTLSLQESWGSKPADELPERMREVLFAIVNSYIEEGTPVGSRALSKKISLEVSPATLRNIMADLTEVGLLKQPHTSSGRIPSENAYRLYVESVARQSYLTQHQKEQLTELAQHEIIELNGLLQKKCEQLSHITQCMAIAVSPHHEAAKLRKVEFIPLQPQRFCIVLATHSNMVFRRIVQASTPVSKEALQRAANLLNKHFGARSLHWMGKQAFHDLMEEKDQYDKELAQVLRIGRKALALAAERRLYVSGVHHLVSKFEDAKTVETLLRLLEKQTIFIHALDRAAVSADVSVTIGKENPTALNKCALIGATYHNANIRLGAIGVLGPLGLPYSSILPVVRHSAHILSKTIAKNSKGSM